MIDNHQRLIIIDGVPYSGTTLLTYLLAHHPDVLLACSAPQCPLLENSWLSTQDAPTIEAILKSSPTPRILLKRPWTIYRGAEWLTRDFPSARFLYCVRNEASVISSWLRRGDFEGDTLQQVMKIDRETYAEAEKRASLFRLRVPYFLFVQLEDLLANPVDTLNNIGAWLGLSSFKYDTSHVGCRDIKLVSNDEIISGDVKCLIL
jgi:Sulfotransferase family